MPRRAAWELEKRVGNSSLADRCGAARRNIGPQTEQLAPHGTLAVAAID